MNRKIKTILASSSPRRLELLKLIDIEPEVLSPMIPEDILSGEPPERFVSRMAVEKGNHVRRDDHYDSLIISADTIVLIDKKMIGKPSGREEAFEMLKILSGEKHNVITGVSLIYRDKEIIRNSVTEVNFSNISSIEINKYLDNESYMDKAGAYAIQGKASVFVKNINGCYFNVMGFPLNLFYSMLKILEISIEDL